MASRLSSVVIALPLLMAACGGTRSTPTAPSPASTTPASTATVTGGAAPTSAEPFQNIAATLTEDSQIGIVAASPDGHRLGVTTQRGSASLILGVSGATLTLQDGSRVVVYVGTDGLPARAVFGDVIVLFSNYTSSSVDISAVGADGTAGSSRNVPVDPGALADLRVLPRQLSASAFVAGPVRSAALSSSAMQNFALGLKIGGTLLSVASCGTAAAASVATVGASLVIATGACVSAVVQVAKLIQPELDAPLLTASGALLSGTTCASGSVYGCTTIIVRALQIETDAANTFLSSRPAPVPPTPSIQVDGTWTGRTGQGEAFSLRVENYRVTTFFARYSFTGLNCQSVGGVSPDTDIAIADNAFQWSGTFAPPGPLSYAISGTFASSSSASGTLNITLGPACGGTVGTTWTASK